MITFQALAPGCGDFVEIPTPTPKNDEVLVKISYCGICGTDYALYSGNSGFIKNGQATYPIRLGHEWSGVVEKVGEKVTKVKSGDRVIGDNFTSCGKCPSCIIKDYGNCEDRKHVGTIDPCWPGAFAEYYILPERHVYKLADNVSLLEAALCEPLSVAYGGIKAMDIKPDSVVLVIGTGSIGMSAAALALQKGAKQVYMLGRNAFKLEKALELGITAAINSSKEDPEKKLLSLTGGRYADLILECSGSASAFNQGIQLAARWCNIALIGFYEQKIEDFDIDTFVTKQMKMVGIMGEFGNIEAVSEIMANCDLKMKNIITDIVPFKDCREAFSPQSFNKIIKTVVKF